MELFSSLLKSRAVEENVLCVFDRVRTGWAICASVVVVALAVVFKIAVACQELGKVVVYLSVFPLYPQPDVRDQPVRPSSFRRAIPSALPSS